MTRFRWGVAFSIVNVLLLTACGSDDEPTERGVGEAPAADASAEQPRVDACTLLDAGDVEPYIGANDGGKPDDGIGESACAWENEDGTASVGLDVGRPGTASQLTEFAPSDPGPDGIAFDELSTGWFDLDGRMSQVQVVVFKDEAYEHDAMTDLVGKVRAHYETAQ